jgi:hypothetical protein
VTWWSSLYFALYITFSLWSVTDDLRRKTEALWHVALEGLGDVCVLLVAVSYWLPSLRAALSPELLVLYVLGLVAFAAQASRSFRKHVLLDKELPVQGKVFVALSAAALITIVSAPALVWGFYSAVLGRASA